MVDPKVKDPLTHPYLESIHRLLVSTSALTPFLIRLSVSANHGSHQFSKFPGPVHTSSHNIFLSVHTGSHQMLGAKHPNGGNQGSADF